MTWLGGQRGVLLTFLISVAQVGFGLIRCTDQTGKPLARNVASKRSGSERPA